jgi:hypothetical protein
VNQELMTASQNKNVDAFLSLSKLIKELQDKIDKAYARLETVTMKHDEKLKIFEPATSDV